MNTSTINTIATLEAKYNTAIVTIRGYVNDAKDFGFEPTELSQMQAQAQAILTQIEELKKISL